LRDFQNNAGLLMLSSIINLFLGLFIVLNHNTWELSWKVALTILGYLILLKGILNLFFPRCMLKMTKKYMEKDIFVYSGVISLVLGLYLLYHGYSPFLYNFWTKMLG